MKNRLLLYLLLILSIFTACKDHENDTINSSTEYLVAKPITINFNIKEFDERFACYFFGPEQDYFFTKKDSIYQISFKSSRPVLCEYQYFSKFKYPLFAYPGDSIKITLSPPYEMSKALNPIISGSSREENKLLKELSDKIYAEDKANYQLYAKKESDFLELLEQKKSNGERQFRSQAKKFKDEKTFKRHFDTYLKYKLAYYLNNFPEYKRKYFNQKDFAMSESIKNKLHALLIEEEDLLSNRLYQDFLLQAVYAEASEFSDPKLKFQHINAMFEKKTIRDFLNFRIMMNELSNLALIRKINPRKEQNEDEEILISGKNLLFETAKRFEGFIDDYKETLPTSDYLSKIQKNYQNNLN